MWKRVGPRFWDIAPINENGEFIPIPDVCMGVAQNTAEPGEIVYVVKWQDIKDIVYDVQDVQKEARI